MKSSRLLKYFEEYIKKIDMNNTWAKAKYFHSLKSMDLAKIIATNLNVFTEEEIVIIELIALFHDIGSFNEKNFDYLDQEQDSTMKSIDILFKDGLIRKITDETKYDNLIKLAIFCHNKEGLPKQIDDKTVTICNIMKDVYRLEELRMVINYPFIDNRINTYPTAEIYSDFKLFREIDKSIGDNNADNILITISHLFGMNYKISYSLIKENEYIKRIIESLIYEDKKIEKFFIQIENVLNTYLEKKINS